MKRIEVGCGLFTEVDDELYPSLIRHKWYLNRRDGRYYVERRNRNGEKRLMHREIMDATLDQEIDHIDGNGLNNQRSNLRIATRSQIVAKARPTRNKASKYKGVAFVNQTKKWRVMIQKEGMRYYLGAFEDEEDAARAYNNKARELFGSFARLNRVDEWNEDERSAAAIAA